jgi:hypothetical protein
MQVMDLDAWLRTSDRVRRCHGLEDAWAITNTDCAFRINDVTAVQRSSRANDWNYFGGDLAQVCCGGDDRSWLIWLAEPGPGQTHFAGAFPPLMLRFRVQATPSCITGLSGCVFCTQPAKQA